MVWYRLAVTRWPRLGGPWKDRRVAEVTSAVLTRHFLRHGLVTAAVVGVAFGSTRIETGDLTRDVMVSLHIVGLVVGLGCVLLLDWSGLAWMMGLRRLRECLRLAEAARPLIWVGVALLLVSGLFLKPDFRSWLPWVKMAAVVLVVNNGIVVDALDHQLRQLPSRSTFETLPTAIRKRLMTTATVSQLMWWTAAVIGMVTSATRR